MISFICIGIVKLCDTQNKPELENEKFLPTVGFDLSTSRWLDRRVIHLALKPIYRSSNVNYMLISYY